MKHAKRLLALLLTLIFSLCLALPAIAAQPSVNWDDFYIVTPLKSMNVPVGESFTLRVDVNIPEGVEVEYKWLQALDYIPIEGAGNSPTFQYTLKNRDDYISVRCIVIGYEKSEDGTVLSQKELNAGYSTVYAEESAARVLFNKIVLALLAPFEWLFVGMIAGGWFFSIFGPWTLGWLFGS